MLPCDGILIQYNLNQIVSSLLGGFYYVCFTYFADMQQGLEISFQLPWMTKFIAI